jgi:hypothetical protein
MIQTFKSFQRYNAIQQKNLQLKNRPDFTQEEYLTSVNKLNIILNSLKLDPPETQPEGDFVQTQPEGDFVQTQPEGDFVQTQPEGDFVQTQPEGDFVQTQPDEPKTPRKRRTKKEIELDLEHISQKQKDYVPVEHQPPSKPIKPMKPKPPAKIIVSNIAVVRQK